MSHKDLFPQPLDQTTLTTEWINTCKSEHNDADIELARKTTLSDRERRVNQKREVRSLSRRIIVVSLRSGIEMSEVTHEKYVEIKGDASESFDFAFDTRRNIGQRKE